MKATGGAGRTFVFASCLLIAGCSSSGVRPAAPTGPPLQLPVFERACPVHPDASPLVPVRVLRYQGEVEIVANVCINGSGPFPFLVDTGAATTLVDSTLAARLQLPRLSSPQTVNSFGCRRQFSISLVDDWSVGDTRLDPRTIATGTVSTPRFPNLDGLLGSDTLSQFGAVRIDYRNQMLTLGSDRTPLSSSVAGSSFPASIPSSITAGTSFASPMPVQVFSEPVPGQLDSELTVVRPTVEMTLGSEQYKLVVDTGAAFLVLDPSVANQQRLTQVGAPRITYGGLACPVRVTFYWMPEARLDRTPVPQQLVGSNQVGTGIDGLFGSGTLAMYKVVAVDYADGELFLGSPSAGTAKAPVVTGAR